MFDEAGNIPIHGLKEMLGVGRGRKVAVVLAYQNLGQVYAAYGSDGADAVLGSINSTVFLPGLDQRTTTFAASRVGKSTVLQRTTVDAPGTQNDAERLAETKRDLIDPAELRQLVRHKQAVAIIDTAPPIKFSYPPLIQAAPSALSNGDYKGEPHPIGLKRAEMQEKSLERMSPLEPQSSQGSVGEPTIIKERQRTRQRKAEPARRKQATDNLPFDPRS